MAEDFVKKIKTIAEETEPCLRASVRDAPARARPFMSDRIGDRSRVPQKQPAAEAARTVAPSYAARVAAGSLVHRDGFEYCPVFPFST